MPTEYTQPFLFPDMKPILEAKNNYQVRSVDDPSFSLSMNVSESEDPETKALDTLGYFIVAEVNHE